MLPILQEQKTLTFLNKAMVFRITSLDNKFPNIINRLDHHHVTFVISNAARRNIEGNDRVNNIPKV